MKHGRDSEKGGVTYDEREMKFGLEFGFTYGVPSILIMDDRQEMVGDLVTQ